MTITQTQINDLRLDAGLPADTETVFDNDEMDRIWTRVSGASSDAKRHEAALGLMYRQLLSNAAKLNDYRIATSSENKSQIFKNIKTLYDMYRPSLEEALDVAVDQIAFGSMRPLVRDRDRPRGSEEGWDDSIFKPPFDF